MPASKWDSLLHSLHELRQDLAPCPDSPQAENLDPNLPCSRKLEQAFEQRLREKERLFERRVQQLKAGYEKQLREKEEYIAVLENMSLQSRVSLDEGDLVSQ
jgi:hypothetical protein